ncbi:MAG TPA: helix-turn-helix domain-containing protein [Anaerolineae bacterium]|nr:helix-turn-helix domain-containing protein [Anaerolineae bacterium]
MDEIGNILYAARIAKQVTLDQAHQRLKIQKTYLSAMEKGHFELLPTAVHARGYLKNYAKFLELDPQPLLDNYKEQLASIKHKPRRATTNGTGTVHPNGDTSFFDPVNMQLNPMRGGTNAESVLRLIIIFALLAAIILVASRFFVAQNPDRSFGPVETVTHFYRSVILGETPETAAEIAPQEAAIEESAEPDLNNPLLIETSRNVVDDADIPTAVPNFNCPLNEEVMTIKIDATERVWMQLYIDGDLQVQDNVKAGESLEYIAEKNFRINTGNAYAIYVTVNNEPLGRLGNPQQVQDITCETVAQ